ASSFNRPLAGVTIRLVQGLYYSYHSAHLDCRRAVTRCGHCFMKDAVVYIQSGGVKCGLRLATGVRQDKQGVRRRSVDEVWIDGKSTRAVLRRLANVSEHPTSVDEEMDIVKKLI